ncbi:hypothetical protein [Microbacterium panaciterrae]|uniref:Integral membrane protein n=1 Tax=Microbacterium panaciterrae TaxID=985759 RepID=A0ABP8PAY4_9MICO
MTEDRGASGSAQRDPRAEARAALDALPRVAQRRDEVLDRRALARIYLVDAIVPTVAFASWVLAQALRDASVRTHAIPTLATLLVVVLWDQLSRGLRERYRARQALRGAPRIMQNILAGVGAGLLLLALFITFDRRSVPVVLVVIGSVILLGSGVGAAAAMLRDARGTPKPPPAQHAEMTVAARVATVLFGLGLGLIAVVGPWSAAGTGSESLALIPALLALAIAGIGRLVNAVPALGAAWRPPQWTAFALSVTIACLAPIIGAARPADGVALGVIAAAAVLLLFLVTALFPADRNG